MPPSVADTLTDGGARLDDKEVARLIKAQREGADTDIPYFVGRFLEKRDPPRAREYLLRAARSERMGMLSTMLARYRSTQLGILLQAQPASAPASMEAAR